MKDKPNIVLLMTDSQGADMVGAYNPGLGLKTPNLDKLAGEGVKFDRAYTSSPLCAPARAGLFTGMSPLNTGVVTNGQALASNVRTMGQLMSEKGYDCAYIGKWHLDGHDYFGTGVCPEGWDPEYWYDGRNYLDELSDDEKEMWRYGLNSVEDLENNNITEEFCWAHKNSDKAIDFMSKDRENPFLLVVSYDEPHHPWTCPPQYLKDFTGFQFPLGKSAFDDLSDKPEHFKTWSESSFGISEPIDTFRHDFFFASNSYVDYEIGRVVDEIKQKFGDDTIIFYTADHGEMHGAHKLKSKGPATFDEITRVPFIVNGPGRFVLKSDNHTVVSHLDIIPTILDYASEKPSDNLEGGSLRSFIQDGACDDDREVFIEYSRYETSHDGFGAFQPYRSIVTGFWKLTLHLENTDELYNLNEDPEEMRNLISVPGYEDVRESLFNALIDHMNEVRDPMRGSHWNRRSWRSSEVDDWSGPERPKPDDGSGLVFYDYNKGIPMKGPAERY